MIVFSFPVLIEMLLFWLIYFSLYLWNLENIYILIQLLLSLCFLGCLSGNVKWKQMNFLLLNLIDTVKAFFQNLTWKKRF